MARYTRRIIPKKIRPKVARPTLPDRVNPNTADRTNSAIIAAIGTRYTRAHSQPSPSASSLARNWSGPKLIAFQREFHSSTAIHGHAIHSVIADTKTRPKYSAAYLQPGLSLPPRIPCHQVRESR